MSILLALITAVGWGAADFFGGAARRKTPVFVVLAVSQVIGFAALVPVLLARGVPVPSDPRILFACLAGCGVTLELRLIYIAISEGDAFITAPVGALGTTIAVIVGLVGGDRLNLTIGLGILCALIGGGLSARGSNGNHRSRGPRSALRRVGICVGGASGVGIALASLHAAGRVDPYWATAFVDLSTLMSAGGIALASQRQALRRRLPRRTQLPPLALGAIAGVVGDLTYAVASHHGGALSVVSALSSLYPLATVALGVVIQGQRSDAPQIVGTMVALSGAALLGAAAG